MHNRKVYSCCGHLFSKFGIDWSNESKVITISSNSKWPPSAVLDFQRTSLSRQTMWLMAERISAVNLVKLDQTSQKLWRFFEIQDGRRPPSWIFIWRHSCATGRWMVAGSMSHINVVWIGWLIRKLQQFPEIQDGRRPPSWIFIRRQVCSTA